MKLLVGLGNPGAKYAATRHNIGFMVVEQIARNYQVALKKKGYQGIYGVGSITGQQTTVLLPQTFMNNCGASVAAAYKSLGIAPGDLIVVYDDLDLPFGRLRIKKEGGHGGHNGIRDILSVLGCRDFIRVRIGIGRPEYGDVVSHVLSPFRSNEQKLLPQLLDAASEATEMILAEGVSVAMNTFNGFNLDD